MKRRRGSGFTLLEVMVAFTLLGFILLILFSAFRLGVSAWQRGESTKEEEAQLRAASQLVGRQIKSAVPYRIKTQKAEGNYLAFEGKPQSLKFVSALPIRGGQPEGFVYAMYEFKSEGGEEGRLVLYEQKALNKDFFEESQREDLGVSLLEGISDVRFEYFRPEDPNKNQSEGWVEEWNTREEKILPKAVRITISRKPGRNGKEETPITLLAAIPANRFEEVRVSSPSSPGLGRRVVREGAQQERP